MEPPHAFASQKANISGTDPIAVSSAANLQDMEHMRQVLTSRR